MTNTNTDPYALQCAPGEEAIPADEVYVCGPADEAIVATAPTHPPVTDDPATFYEVAFYVYKKLDVNAPASWPNSGVQDLIATQPGTAYFTEFPGVLPDYVCGEGWGVQQDKVAHTGGFAWPESIEYPDDNIGWPPIYAAQHAELSDYVEVPECVTVTPEPTPPATPPRELAETGFDPLTAIIFAGSVFLVGSAVLVARSLRKGAKA